MDSGLAQFLGRRLQEDQRGSRLQSLNNPEPMTDLGPGLGNATMRGDQVWVETLGPGEGQREASRRTSVNNQEAQQRQAGPSVHHSQGREQLGEGLARQQSRSGRTSSTQN